MLSLIGIRMLNSRESGLTRERKKAVGVHFIATAIQMKHSALRFHTLHKRAAEI